MADEQPKQVQFTIDDGPTFYSDEISITNNAFKFFFDFKNSSPRIDVRGAEALPVSLKHSVVVMDPPLAKVFAKLLQDHVDKFEKQHGAIPDIAIPKEGTGTLQKDDKPAYFG